jgi:hypothetical protein
MAERITNTEQTVTTGQPQPVVTPTTERTTTTTIQTEPAVVVPERSINVNAPAGIETVGGITVNVPPVGGVTSTTTTTGVTDVNVNEP